MIFPLKTILKIILLICFLIVFSFYLLNEYKFSQYTLTKNLILEDISTIKPTINPAAVTNRFVFLPNVDISSNKLELSDNIFDKDYDFFQIRKLAVLKRQVSICSQPRKLFSFNNEWRSVTQETKYSPDISETIYKDIKIGNFTIAEDILNNESKMRVLSLPSNNIYKDFPNRKKNKFIYTYIGHGWFYHLNEGNVSKVMMKMNKSFSVDSSQVLSLLMKIIFSLLFHSFVYINTGTMSAGTQMSNQDRIINLMTNCNENDVRIKYLYYEPKGRISIVAFKDHNLLMTKEINGFSFGNFVSKNAKSPEEVIPKYPTNFLLETFQFQKYVLPILAFVLFYTSGLSNKYKRDATIIIFSSLVLIIKSSMWKKKIMLIASSVTAITASIVFKFV